MICQAGRQCSAPARLVLVERCPHGHERRTPACTEHAQRRTTPQRGMVANLPRACGPCLDAGVTELTQTTVEVPGEGR